MQSVWWYSDWYAWRIIVHTHTRRYISMGMPCVILITLHLMSLLLFQFHCLLLYQCQVNHKRFCHFQSTTETDPNSFCLWVGGCHCECVSGKGLAAGEGDTHTWLFINKSELESEAQAEEEQTNLQWRLLTCHKFRAVNHQSRDKWKAGRANRKKLNSRSFSFVRSLVLFSSVQST